MKSLALVGVSESVHGRAVGGGRCSGCSVQGGVARTLFAYVIRHTRRTRTGMASIARVFMHWGRDRAEMSWDTHRRPMPHASSSLIMNKCRRERPGRRCTNQRVATGARLAASRLGQRATDGMWASPVGLHHRLPQSRSMPSVRRRCGCV